MTDTAMPRSGMPEALPTAASHLKTVQIQKSSAESAGSRLTMIRSGRRLRARARSGLALLVLSAAALVAAAPAGAATPHAEFDWTPSAPIVGEPVSFDSSGSDCGPAGPCTYVWEDDGGDGAGGTQWALGKGPTLKFTFHYVGRKYVRLKVYDSDNVLRAQTEHDVYVGSDSGSPPPPPPPPPPAGDTTPPDTIVDDGPSGHVDHGVLRVPRDRGVDLPVLGRR